MGGLPSCLAFYGTNITFRVPGGVDLHNLSLMITHRSAGGRLAINMRLGIAINTQTTLESCFSFVLNGAGHHYTQMLMT